MERTSESTVVVNAPMPSEHEAALGARQRRHRVRQLAVVRVAVPACRSPVATASLVARHDRSIVPTCPGLDGRPFPDVGAAEAACWGGEIVRPAQLMDALPRDPKAAGDVGLQHELEGRLLGSDAHRTILHGAIDGVNASTGARPRWQHGPLGSSCLARAASASAPIARDGRAHPRRTGHTRTSGGPRPAGRRRAPGRRRGGSLSLHPRP